MVVAASTTAVASAVQFLAITGLGRRRKEKRLSVRGGQNEFVFQFMERTTSVFLK